MLHTDFGIVYMGFSTDTQHNAYVLKPGETAAPAGLVAGLKAAITINSASSSIRSVPCSTRSAMETIP
jgi:hypothetical protein